MTSSAAVIGLTMLAACAGAAPPQRACAAPAPCVKRAGPLAYLRSTLVPFPSADARGRVALTDPIRGRVAVYDSALVVLVLVRSGARAEAASVLEGLRALQAPDGSLPFSFVLPRPEAVRYVRSGAVAWAGYSAVEYLDSDRAGPSRGAALALARGAADYLLARRVDRPGDPRDGLVRGGEGAYRYELDADGELRERLYEEDITWASVEHNVDAYFFFRALARVTGESRYADAAARVAAGLARAWNGARGQLERGVGEGGPDGVSSLDCASWGSIFLGATGDRDRAETAAFVADAGFASWDPRTGARGHRMHRRGPLFEGELLMRVLGPSLPVKTWDELEAVWPEGSAGVALAALRAGRPERARAILDGLEPLRAADGALPTFTVDIPYLFDTKPSIAGTAWVELVRFELGRPPDRPTFWAP